MIENVIALFIILTAIQICIVVNERRKTERYKNLYLTEKKISNWINEKYTNMVSPNHHYKYTVIYRNADQNRYPLRTWYKWNKYRSYSAAERGLKDLVDNHSDTFMFKIVPYFKGNAWEEPKEQAPINAPKL